MDYGEFEPERIKHLEMIQAVVARLGTNSFLLKGWAVALTTALGGFALNGDDWRLAALACACAAGFWGLDTYFLRAERLFRALFDDVRSGSENVEPFAMGATATRFAESKVSTTWGSVAFSVTLCWFYGLLIAVSAALAVALHCG